MAGYVKTDVFPLWVDSVSGFTFYPSQRGNSGGIAFDPDNPANVYQMSVNSVILGTSYVSQGDAAAIVRLNAGNLTFSAGNIIDTKDTSPPPSWFTGNNQVAVGCLNIGWNTGRLFFFRTGSYYQVADEAGPYWRDTSCFKEVSPTSLAVVKTSPTITASSGVSAAWQYPGSYPGALAVSKTGKYIFSTTGFASSSSPGTMPGIPYALWDADANKIHYGDLSEFVVFFGSGGSVFPWYGQNYEPCPCWDGSDKLWVLLRSVEAPPDDNYSDKRHILVLQPSTGTSVSFSMVANYDYGPNIFLIGLNYDPTANKIIAWYVKYDENRGTTFSNTINPTTGALENNEKWLGYFDNDSSQRGGWASSPLCADFGDFQGPTVGNISNGLIKTYDPANWVYPVDTQYMASVILDSAHSQFLGITSDSSEFPLTTVYDTSLKIGDPPETCNTILQTTDYEGGDLIVDWAGNKAFSFDTDEATKIWLTDTIEGQGFLITEKSVDVICGISGNTRAWTTASCLGGDGNFYSVTENEDAYTSQDYSSLKLSKIAPGNMTEIAAAALATAEPGTLYQPWTFRIAPFTLSGVHYVSVLVDRYADLFSGAAPGYFEVFKCSDLTSQGYCNYPSSSDQTTIVAGNSPSAGVQNIYRTHPATNPEFDKSPMHFSKFVFTAGSGVTNTLIGNVTTAQLDPAFEFLSSGSQLYFDPSDSTVIASISGRDDSSSYPDYLVKLDTSDASIIWKCPVSNIAFRPNSPASSTNLSGGELVFVESNGYYPDYPDGTYSRIDLATGNATQHFDNFFTGYDGSAMTVPYDSVHDRAGYYNSWYGWSIWDGECAGAPPPVDVDINLDRVTAAPRAAPLAGIEIGAVLDTVHAVGRARGFAEVDIEPPAPPPAKPCFDWFATVISQYANSPIILTLIENFAIYVDPCHLIDAFYDLIWNVDTAQGYGLDIWGRIVGVTRTLSVSAGDLFGFNEFGRPAQPFNQAPFYTGFNSITNFELNDDTYRTLIFAKALSNISDGSIPAINQLLLNLFPGKRSYVSDDGNMQMTYHFEWDMSEVEQAIVSQTGILPKPTGVAANVEITGIG